MSSLSSPSSPSKLPNWLSPIIFGIISIVVIGVTLIASPDLGTGFIVGGIITFVCAVISIILLALDSSTQRLAWGIAAGILALAGIIGLVGSGSAYRYQINLAEQYGAYNVAAADLTKINEKPPYSQELAKTYLDWAKAEIKANSYPSAIDHLTYLIKEFPTLPQAAQAKTLLPQAHLAYAEYALKQKDPIIAGQEYTIVLTQFTSAPEATKANAEAAAALLAQGDAYYANHYYKEANDSYQYVIKNFAKAPEAAQAHKQAAINLLEWAQKLTDAKQLGDASQHYQDLATNYTDTDQGQQAKKLLTSGVSITGRLFRSDSKTPVYLHTTVRISTKWSIDSGGAIYIASGTQYFADTDSNGYYQFPSIPAGQYLLEWRSTTGAFQTFLNGATPTEIITVPTLQALVLPAITTDQK